MILTQKITNCSQCKSKNWVWATNSFHLMWRISASPCISNYMYVYQELPSMVHQQRTNDPACTSLSVERRCSGWFVNLLTIKRFNASSSGTAYRRGNIILPVLQAAGGISILSTGVPRYYSYGIINLLKHMVNLNYFWSWGKYSATLKVVLSFYGWIYTVLVYRLFSEDQNLTIDRKLHNKSIVMNDKMSKCR